MAVLDLLGDSSNEDGNVSSSEVRAAHIPKFTSKAQGACHRQRLARLVGTCLQVRKALAAGRMDVVAQWLGRRYTLVASTTKILDSATGDASW